MKRTTLTAWLFGASIVGVIAISLAGLKFKDLERQIQDSKPPIKTLTTVGPRSGCQHEWRPVNVCKCTLCGRHEFRDPPPVLPAPNFAPAPILPAPNVYQGEPIPAGEHSLLSPKEEPLHKLGWGMAKNENFIINADSKAEADQILLQAEAYRKEIALEWLGKELEEGTGKTIIHIRYDDEEDRGNIWLDRDEERKYHLIWIVTNDLFGPTLKHEVAHVVLETAYPNLDKWVHEGIASRYDAGTVPWYNKEYKSAMERVAGLLQRMDKTQVLAYVRGE